MRANRSRRLQDRLVGHDARTIVLAVLAACRDRTAGGVKDAAHKLKSSARSIGANALADICVALEKAGKTGITLNHGRIQTRAEADGLRRAWGEAFERLKKKLES